MKKNAWYLLKPCVDFVIASCTGLPYPKLCDFAVVDEHGTIKINPIILTRESKLNFFEVQSQDEAEFIVFPFEAKDYIEIGKSEAFIDMLRSIKVYPKNNQKFIICDSADNTGIIPTDFLGAKTCYFKVSLLKQNKNSAYPFSYKVSDHVLQDVSNFNDFRLRYDVSFVGNITNPIRKFVAISVQNEPRLRSRISFDSRIGYEVKDNIVNVKRMAQNNLKGEAREVLFRKITQQSLCILCPPGFGPQSIRFYETLFYGRIPILLDVDIVYPFEDLLDYKRFSVTIPKEDICRTGAFIADFLGRTPKESLLEYCKESRKAFFTWFSTNVRLQRFCEVYLKNT